MKRSTFLKTLSLSAAAACCNLRLFAVPKFALPAPAPNISLPPCLTGEDLFERMLAGAQEFARDGIQPWKFTGDEKNIDHLALESGRMELNERLEDSSIMSQVFIANIRVILDESVRRAASVAKYPWGDIEWYSDWLPHKYRYVWPRGEIIQPYDIARGSMRLSDEYIQAPDTHGIPKPLLHPLFGMGIEVKAVTAFDQNGFAIGWRLRAVFRRYSLHLPLIVGPTSLPW